jgi:uncharacterized protein YacL
VADLAEAGFLDGDAGVPQFVVRELQRLADSGDACAATAAAAASRCSSGCARAPR